MFPILENLRGFFSIRPPVVLFMICLGSFAIALMTFAYLVKVKDIKNPDVSEDWNTLLEKFSEIEFCLSNNVSESEDFSQFNSTSWKLSYADLSPSDMISKIDETLSHPRERRQITSARLVKGAPVKASKQLHIVPLTKSSLSSSISPHTVSAGEEIMIVTVVLDMVITPSPTKEMTSLQLTSLPLMTILRGQQLNVKGDFADKEMVITITIPLNLTDEMCDEHKGKDCVRYLLPLCVSFRGPTSLFPRTRKPAMSEMCQAGASEASFRYLSTPKSGSSSPANWCHSGSKLSSQYTIDESLTVLLSLQDRSLINLHLMRTSYFLFVMVVTLLCYAMIRGRPSKTKVVNIPYVEKVPTGP